MSSAAQTLRLGEMSVGTMAGFACRKCRASFDRLPSPYGALCPYCFSRGDIVTMTATRPASQSAVAPVKRSLTAVAPVRRRRARLRALEDQRSA